MRMPIAKEGMVYGIMLLIVGVVFLSAKLVIAGSIFIIFSVFIFLFFRYPDRVVSNDSELIYAPADGRIVYIGDEDENTYFMDTVNRVSIFMSLFNVHINYAPIKGAVELVRYSPGRFTRANLVGLVENNENNFIGISNGSTKVGVRQVAGWIARRIVCDCKTGDNLSAGRRIGLIKFGSRVDVYFPKNYNVCLKLGECVRAGRTVLGRE